MKAKNYILLIGFLLAISFPVINGIIPILPDTANNENRRLKSFPDLDTCSIEKMSSYVEDYLVDNNSIRNRMIKMYNHLNIFVFRSSPVSIKAFVGKNGWYFMSGEEIKTFNGTSLFKQQELDELKTELEKRKKIIEQHNAHFLFAIVPNKPNIYPEYMPDHITQNEGYGKQVLHYLQENNFPVIDLYTPLIKAKKTHELYYQTDNHWNDLGAFVAANAILKEFKTINKNVNPLDTSIYKIKRVIEKPGNIAKMFSIENERTETNYIPLPKNGLFSVEKKLNKYSPTPGFPYPQDYEYTRYTNNDSLPSVLIIRDSFGTKLYPYISEQSSKCVTIYDNWQYSLNEPIIKGENPNIVLLLVLESNLRNIVKCSK